jgi:hypothetical protein
MYFLQDVDLRLALCLQNQPSLQAIYWLITSITSSTPLYKTLWQDITPQKRVTYVIGLHDAADLWHSEPRSRLLLGVRMSAMMYESDVIYFMVVSFRIVDLFSPVQLPVMIR